MMVELLSRLYKILHFYILCRTGVHFVYTSYFGYKMIVDTHLITLAESQNFVTLGRHDLVVVFSTIFVCLVSFCQQASILVL